MWYVSRRYASAIHLAANPAAMFPFRGRLLPAQDASAPDLEKCGVVTQLVVDGKPFQMLAGELHNSSSSNLDYMKPE